MAVEVVVPHISIAPHVSAPEVVIPHVSEPPVVHTSPSEEVPIHPLVPVPLVVHPAPVSGTSSSTVQPSGDDSGDQPYSDFFVIGLMVILAIFAIILVRDLLSPHQ